MSRRKKPVELTKLPCKANVYFHVIKIFPFYLSYCQTNRVVGNFGEKRYDLLSLDLNIILIVITITQNIVMSIKVDLWIFLPVLLRYN